MTRPIDGPKPADGPDTQLPVPSTRRVSLGSPAEPIRPAGEPPFSAPVDPADAIFAALKDRISRLWDGEASPADIQEALASAPVRKD